MAGCCHKGRQVGARGDSRARGGGTSLSRRQAAEQTVWVRVWPRGIGQSQSHDHQAVRGEKAGLRSSREAEPTLNTLRLGYHIYATDCSTLSHLKTSYPLFLGLY